MQVETGFAFYEQFLMHKINSIVLYTSEKIICWAIIFLEKVVALIQKYKSYGQFSDNISYCPKKFSLAGWDTHSNWKRWISNCYYS